MWSYPCLASVCAVGKGLEAEHVRTLVNMQRWEIEIAPKTCLLSAFLNTETLETVCLDFSPFCVRGFLFYFHYSER